MESRVSGGLCMPRLICLSLLATLIGYGMDLILGDPKWIYHPVRLIGHLIAGCEKCFRKLFPTDARGQIVGGIATVIVVVLTTGGVVAGILYGCYRIHPAVYVVVASILNWNALAVRSLSDESKKVYDALRREDLEGAHGALSMIVGRDTAGLDRAAIARAAVETVAENTSDGIVAPLLYLLLGGPVLGWIYKAVNTMDSMLGYRNERYLYFGRAAARMDDGFNFLPSRVCARMMIAVARVTDGFDADHARKIYRRDRAKHASPNSAQTESAAAGALRVRLGGEAVYGGVATHKELIGDDLSPIEAEDILRANRLARATSHWCLLWFGAIVCAVAVLLTTVL